MRIAIFQTGPLAPGGTEFVVHHIANQLVELGNDVVVFVGKPLAGPRPKAIYQMMPHLYRVHQFTCPIMKGLSRPWASWHLWKIVRSSQCEIVHAHTLHSSGHIAVRARPLLKIPVLVTGHGEDIQVDRELGYGYRLQPRHDREVRFALANADGATAISRSMAEDMLACGAHRDRLWVVPNGIHLNVVKDPEPLARERPYIFAMGRLVPKKGFEVLLKAFAEVRRSEEGKVDLLIAGDGPERERLQALAGQLGLDGSLHFVGYLDELQKARALAGARFFICPSLREPLGIVNLEAMAAGSAVIGADVDGIPDLIEPGRNGLLFPRGDAAALASHILTLLRNPELAQGLGRAGRVMAADYTWAKIAGKYLQIYLQLCEGEKTGAEARGAG
jgi:glycosyltransferase involved in cell wall biosynthesis